MIERRLATERGTLTLRAPDEACASAAAALWPQLGSSGLRVEPLTFTGSSSYLKSEPTRGHARWRHGVWARALGRVAPALREFENLEWLRERGFEAARPLCAGALHGTLGLRHQFIVTGAISGARQLDHELAASSSGKRTTLIRALAAKTARMHALRFVHRDLYPRNILVSGVSDLALIDCRAGGSPRPGRDDAYDLACLFLGGEQLFTPDEASLFFATYRSRRGELDLPAPSSLERRVSRARGSLIEQLSRNPERLRGAPLPDPGWQPPRTRV